METKSAIPGVIIRKLETHHDSRGSLTELFRIDWLGFVPTMGYHSFTKYCVSRGPHQHSFQTDVFVFAGPGDFILCLWDLRSPELSSGNKAIDLTCTHVHERLLVGENNPVMVTIPPNVAHGYRSISNPGSVSLNFPDRLFSGLNRSEPVDEIRHEDADSLLKIPSLADCCMIADKQEAAGK